MEVSEQIIQVLDAVCDKLGVVIDWSQKNVLPYAQDLMRRVVLLEILTSTVWIIVLGAAAFLSQELSRRSSRLKRAAMYISRWFAMTNSLTFYSVSLVALLLEFWSPCRLCRYSISSNALRCRS